MSWTVSGITLAKAWVEEGSGQMLGWWKVLGYVDIDMEERRSWRIDSGTLRAVEEEDRTMSYDKSGVYERVTDWMGGKWKDVITLGFVLRRSLKA